MVAINNLLEFDNIGRTRGHRHKLKNNRFDNDTGKYTFSSRVINKWNTLPFNVIHNDSINSSKKNIDRFYRNFNVL